MLLAGLFPLLMVARARFKQGYFAELPAALRHGEAVATVQAVAHGSRVADLQALAHAAASQSASRPLWLRRTPLTMAATLGALALWWWPAFPVTTPVFTVDQAAAVARAEAVLAERGVRLDTDWKRLIIVRPAAGGGNKVLRFVWREAGPQVFKRLLGTTILPQHWQVVFKHPSGPVEDRSEVWEVALTGQGEVLAVEHHLPEARPGARLSREQAQALVHNFMASQKALANRPWELASVQENARPARRDWTFYWDDKQALNVKGGTSRVAVMVRGDEMAAWQYVFVPESWTRAWQEADSAKTPFRIAVGAAGAALLLLILVTTLRQVVQGTWRWRQGLTWGALFFVATMAESALTWDHKAMGFNVAQDWNMQMTTSVAMAVPGYLLGAALLGLLAMRLHSNVRPTNATVASDLLRGLALAMVLQGVAKSFEYFLSANDPGLPGVGAWDSIQPLLTTALRGPVGICVALATVALTVSAVHFCHTRRRAVLLGSMVALLALSGTFAAETLATGVALVVPGLLGVLTLWALVRRGEIGVAIASIALSPITILPQLLAAPIANAAVHATLACMVAIGLTWWALRYGRSLGRD